MESGALAWFAFDRHSTAVPGDDLGDDGETESHTVLLGRHEWVEDRLALVCGDAAATVDDADFGLARSTEDPALTMSGMLLGTPRYMSPEQAEVTRRQVDHRSDIYSLGATLYELMTCRPAFEEKTSQEILLAILVREPIAPRRLNPAIPVALETVVMKAMAKRPEDRYQSANDLAEDLEHWLKTEPVKARRIGPVRHFVGWCRRNIKVVAAVGALASVLVIAGGLYRIASVREHFTQQRTSAGPKQNTEGHKQPGDRDQTAGLIETARPAPAHPTQNDTRSAEVSERRSSDLTNLHVNVELLSKR